MNPSRLLLSLLLLNPTVPQGSEGPGSLELLCGYFVEQITDAEAKARLELGMTDSLPELERKRLQLELKQLESEHALLDLLCNDGGPEPSLETRHAAERLALQARQARCHRDGKQLAIEEARRSPATSLFRARTEACIESGIAAAEIRFSAADGGVVFGKLLGAGSHAVVLAHGGRFTKESWQAQAAELADQGHLVLAFDFRGRGRSAGPADAPPDSEFNDVLGAVRYLRDTKDATTVSLIGASFGGWAAARASMVLAPGSIDHLILLAPSSVEEPEAMQGCKLFVVAEDDVRGGGVRRVDEIRAQYERASEPKQLVILPGSAHAQHLFETEQADELMRLMLAFLKAPCEGA